MENRKEEKGKGKMGGEEGITPYKERLSTLEERRERGDDCPLMNHTETENLLPRRKRTAAALWF